MLDYLNTLNCFDINIQNFLIKPNIILLNEFDIKNFIQKNNLENNKLYKNYNCPFNYSVLDIETCNTKPANINKFYVRKDIFVYEIFLELLLSKNIKDSYNENTYFLLRKQLNIPKKMLNILHYRLSLKYTLEEIGNILGVTKERVRQIESKIFRSSN